MAIDPALAGLLGALVGGGATFAGTVISNTQQARHSREQQRVDRKAEAYSNSLRSLLRAANGQFAPKRALHSTGELVGGDDPNHIARSFDAYVDAQYWLTVLATVCAVEYRSSIQEAATSLIEEGTEEELGRYPVGAARKAYEVVAEIALSDLNDKK